MGLWHGRMPAERYLLNMPISIPRVFLLSYRENGSETARQMTEYQKMGFSIEGTEESGKIEVWING